MGVLNNLPQSPCTPTLGGVRYSLTIEKVTVGMSARNSHAEA